jgi:hypothetical protein
VWLQATRETSPLAVGVPAPSFAARISHRPGSVPENGAVNSDQGAVESKNT